MFNLLVVVSGVQISVSKALLAILDNEEFLVRYIVLGLMSKPSPFSNICSKSVPPKAYAFIKSTLSGRIKFSIDLQFKKHLSGISTIDCPNCTSFNFSQFSKTPLPKLTMFSGRIIEVISEFAKAPSLNVVKLAFVKYLNSSKLQPFSSLTPANAVPIEVTASASALVITISLIVAHP